MWASSPVAGSKRPADATIGMSWVGRELRRDARGRLGVGGGELVGEPRGLVVEAERERGAALRVEGPQVGAVGLVGPRHGRAGLPAGGGELLAGEVDGHGGVGERVDGVALGVGQVGQLGPRER